MRCGMVLLCAWVLIQPAAPNETRVIDRFANRPTWRVVSSHETKDRCDSERHGNATEWSKMKCVPLDLAVSVYRVSE